MKNTFFKFFRILLMLLPGIVFFSCSKNSNSIKGDAKIRYFQISVNDTTQRFYLNGILSGATTTYGSNGNYLVVGGDSTYTITSRTILPGATDLASVSQRFDIGSNYSIYFTRKSATTAPTFTVYKDDVKKNLDSVKLTFLNLGYTLGSEVVIKDDANSFSQFNMKYGDRVTHTIKLSKSTRVSFELVTPIGTQPTVNALDSLPTTTSKSVAITKGLVYTVLLDGTKKGELQMRLISSN